MSKAIFAFTMGATVTMPKLNGTRGKIRSRQENDDGEPHYFVEALAGSLRAPRDWFSESELNGANPPEFVPVSEPASRAVRTGQTPPPLSIAPCAL